MRRDWDGIGIVLAAVLIVAVLFAIVAWWPK
jgi:hypothetical protein